MLISVILPVFNGEYYIRQAIESVLNQSYKNLELIIVNDGSTDLTRVICEEFVASDNRIILINQNNVGVSVSRWVGVESCRGEWVTFVDADDSLIHSALADLVSEIADKYALIISDEYALDFNSNTYIEALLKGELHVGPVAKLFKRELFSKFVFEVPRNLSVGEDLIMNIRIALNINNYFVKVIQKKVYQINENNLRASLSTGFKRSIEYEERYYEELLNSFSLIDRENFKYPLIAVRLRALKLIYLDQGYKLDKKSKFYVRLVGDVKRSNFQPGLEYYFLLYSECLYFLFVQLHRVYYGLKRKLGW